MKKIIAVGRLLTLTVGISVTGFSQVTGDFQTKSATGDWSDFNAWNVFNGTIWTAATFGQIPSATTGIFVQAGHNINVDDASAICNDLNVNGAITSKILFTASTSVLNVKGNMTLFSTGHNCFGTWTTGARIVFSGAGAQVFINLSVNSVFTDLEVNKPSGTLSTSSNFRFGSFTLTSGNFLVGAGDEIQGNSAASTINIKGGTWSQTQTTTKINNSGIQASPIGALDINGGTMILATSNAAGGFRFSTISISNAGTLTLNNFSGNLSIASSIIVDEGSVFNTSLSATPLPLITTFDGIVNYNNAGAQTISPAAYAYLKLSGTGTKTLGTGTTIITANGFLEMSGSSPSPILVPAGTLAVSPTGTTLLYSSLANQFATVNEWDDNFQNITVNSGGTVSMAGLSKVINGTLTLNSGILNIGASSILNLNGPLVTTSGFIDGTSTSDLNIAGTTGGVVSLPLSGNISLQNAAISGNRTLLMDGVNNINLSGNFVIAAGATYDNGGESQITGGGSISISGLFITRDIQGFFATGASIPGIIPVLNTGSTIEYGLMGDQSVQGSTVSYQNITFSGSGIKTPASLFTPVGTFYVTGSAIVDASNHNIGDGTVGTTNLTMDGGELILVTTGTQPMMNGAYNLTGGLIRFANTGATVQRIRSPETYYGIEVTGTNVSNSLGNIDLAPSGTFTIKAGAKFTINADQLTGATGMQNFMVEAGGEFDCGNADGFSGGDGTAGKSTSVNNNVESITLMPGSTVNYLRSGIQAITNQIAYQNFEISGTAIKTAPTGILVIQGDLVKSGTSTFAHNGGTVLLNGPAAQNFAGLTYNNLLLVNNAKATAGNSVIIDSIKISPATILSIGALDTIILHSDLVKTARMAQVDGTINYNSTGKFVVERYISAKRAWRFLSVPTTSSQTIKQAWQEGALNAASDPANGHGTQITSNSSSWLIDGFDAFSAGGPSLKTYNPVTNDYAGVSTTLSPFSPALGGYMTFIRGDRTATTIASPVTATILRAAGQLFTGAQSPVNVISGQITPYNNPYASSIDLRQVSKSFNVFYYVWDPNRAGFGAFQTLSWNGIDYDVVPGNSGSYGATNNFIESGQAFFVSTMGADTSMLIDENAKSAATFTNPPFFTLRDNSPQLRVNLYGIAPDGSNYLADGVLNKFGAYSNDIDGQDARKFPNIDENLAVKSGEKLLVIESRQVLTKPDTILLDITRMRYQPYQFSVSANNFDNAIECFLEDDFLHKRTRVNLHGSTLINFTVENIAASYAAGRFKMVFAHAVVLPVTFTSVKAYRENKSIKVKWRIENEKDIKHYEVEKSVNGAQFLTKFLKEASVSGSLTASYMITDINPVEGNNYYRVKSVDINNKITYSNVVEVLMPDSRREISLFPNPVNGRLLHLRFLNQPLGNYFVRLLSTSGQVIISRQINLSGSDYTWVIKLNYGLEHGMYQVEVIKPGGATSMLDVLL